MCTPTEKINNLLASLDEDVVEDIIDQKLEEIVQNGTFKTKKGKLMLFSKI